MEEIKKYRFDVASPVIPKIRFQGVEYLLRFMRYRRGNMAIYLENWQGPYAELTIELPDIRLQQYQVLVKQTLEGIDVPDLLHRAGIVEKISISSFRGEADWLYSLRDALLEYIAYQGY